MFFLRFLWIAKSQRFIVYGLAMPIDNKMSRDIRDKMQGGCHFENNLNQTQNCKVQKTIGQLWCKLPEHCIVINSPLISPIFVPAREFLLQSWLKFRENG